jgi:hypothetical protein
MPRQPRLDTPGALHHIMVRGNNKTNIFSDDQDRNKFLQRLGENITEAKCSVYAWVGENFGDVVSEMDLNNLRQVEKVQLTRTSPGQAVECSQLCITQRVEL